MSPCSELGGWSLISHNLDMCCEWHVWEQSLVGKRAQGVMSMIFWKLTIRFCIQFLTGYNTAAHWPDIFIIVVGFISTYCWQIEKSVLLRRTDSNPCSTAVWLPAKAFHFCEHQSPIQNVFNFRVFLKSNTLTSMNSSNTNVSGSGGCQSWTEKYGGRQETSGPVFSAPRLPPQHVPLL